MTALTHEPTDRPPNDAPLDELDCGHKPTIGNGLGTGVARKRDEDGEEWTMCYRCAYVEIMDDIVMTGVADNDMRLPVLYVSSDGVMLTTWDGQEVGQITRWGKRHNLSNRWEDRRSLVAKIRYGADEVNCYGTGAPGMYAVLRRYKSDLQKGQ